MPEPYQCIECRIELSPGAHRFSSNHGGTLCIECQPMEANIRDISVPALKVLRMLHNTELKKLPELHMNQSIAQELDSILGNTIHFWLDKEIRSKTFLEHLRRSATHPIYS